MAFTDTSSLLFVLDQEGDPNPVVAIFTNGKTVLRRHADQQWFLTTLIDDTELRMPLTTTQAEALLNGKVKKMYSTRTFIITKD